MAAVTRSELYQLGRFPLKVNVPRTCTSNSASDCPPEPQGSYDPCPWLVAYDFQCIKDTDQIFYDPCSNTHTHCRIPELAGKEIQACFHGWLILSDYIETHAFSLWNPTTLSYIPLPPLESESLPKSEFIYAYGLSSPPDDPDSILFLFRLAKQSMFFCWLGDARKNWTEMSYEDQMTVDEDRLCSPFCYNGKLYVTTTSTKRLIHIDIRVYKKRRGSSRDNNAGVVIQFVPSGNLPPPPVFFNRWCLTESCGELFAVYICCQDYDSSKLQSIHVFKLDFSAMTWEEIRSAKDHVFFLNEIRRSLFSCPVTELGSHQGNYIYIIWTRNELYSYHMEDKTLSLYFLPCPDLLPKLLPYYTLTWVMPEGRLRGDHQEAKHRSDTKEREPKEELKTLRGDSNSVLNEGETLEGFLDKIPFHILELIAEHCGTIEYLKLRATCKRCRLASPLPIPWVVRLGLPTQSSVIPWLMVLDRDVTSFIDPKFGDKCFMPTHPELIGDGVICSSRYGWLLIFRELGSLVFLNPFTKDIIQLPKLGIDLYSYHFSSFGFSSPPTAPDCLVAGFTIRGLRSLYITSPGKREWYEIDIHPDISYYPSHQKSQAFCGQDLYVIHEGCGMARVLKYSPNNGREILPTDLLPPSPEGLNRFDEHYLVECDNELVLVSMGKFFETVEVFKLNPYARKWDNVRCLGNHMIYICDTTSFSAIAKNPDMGNKIYFPRLYGEDDKSIVFYSLETCNYHTFGHDKQEEAFTDFLRTKRQLFSVWIEPSHSS